MWKVIHCDCGQTVRAQTDEELVQKVSDHVQKDHPDLVGKLSRQDILNMAEEEK